MLMRLHRTVVQRNALVLHVLLNPLACMNMCQTHGKFPTQLHKTKTNKHILVSWHA